MFSKSIEYGYMIIMFLKNKERMTGQEIVEKLSIPKYYGLTILKQLAIAGILSSAKGKTGGFILNKKSITFLELFQIMNENDKKMSYSRDKAIYVDENYITIISELKEKLMKDMKNLII